MKSILAEAAFRLFFLAFTVAFFFAILLGAPYAYLTSAGSYGYTAWREWLDDLGNYSLTGLRGLVAALFGRERLRP